MRPTLAAWLITAGALLHALPPGSAADPQAEPGSGVVELKGRITAGPGANLVFKTEDKREFKLRHTQMAEALFEDQRLHARVLLLKGKIHPPNEFEITGNIHSMKDGKLHEVFYYCDICAITTSFPGLCLCCREPVELVEKPVE